MKVYIVSVLIIFGFLGCNTTKLNYSKLRNDKNLVIKSVKSLSSQKIEDKKSIELQLGDKEKEIIILKGQKVFASKLETPAIQKPFSLQVETSSSAGFFAPKILFLDNNHKVIHTAGAKDLLFDRGYFKGTIFINRKYKKIRYVVITQDLNEVNKIHKVNYVDTEIIPITTGMYTFFYNSSSGDINKTIKNAYGGMVNLTLNIYKANILKEEKK